MTEQARSIHLPQLSTIHLPILNGITLKRVRAWGKIYSCIIMGVISVVCLCSILAIILYYAFTDRSVPQWCIGIITYILGLWSPTPTFSRDKYQAANTNPTNEEDSVDNKSEMDNGELGSN